MAEKKRFYWIKLKENFFDLETIDWLISQKNGCEYIVLYQKLCLLTANKGGELSMKIGEMIIPYDINKIARDTKFSVDTVIVAVELFKKIGLIYEQEDGILKIPYVEEMVGSETSSAKRVREYRQRQEAQKALPNATKTNAERQRAFRAKQACEGKQHIPYIEDYQNKKRYGGNYYIVMKRDGFKCKICGSVENLCVHHIDGYDELKPQNNAENKMVATCRDCHSKIHAGTKIPDDVLDSIDYFYSNESNEFCNTECNGDVTQEIDNRVKRIENRDKIKEEEKKDNIYRQVITHLNDKAGTSYKATSQATQRHINARIADGYTVEDFYTVIDKKCEEWKNSDMSKYLRPETLFGSKFEGYLNQKAAVQTKNNGWSMNQEEDSLDDLF